MAGRPRVVIVGAGFAGLECAKTLAGKPVDVTVVDRNNFHTFSALLYQVATSALAAADVVFPVRGIVRGAGNIGVRRASVRGVDWERGCVELDEGEGLAFDWLVLAAGATTNFFGVAGAEAHAFPLYGLADAIRLRNHVLRQFEEVDADPGDGPEGALTMVVVGGGPTGVEMAGALSELFTGVLARDFPDLDVSRARVVLVEMGDRLLGSFSAVASGHAADQLRDRGIELRLGEAVTAVDVDAVHLRSGEVIPCRTLVWAAGVRANPVAATLGVELDRGRVVVGPDLRVPSRPNLFVVGDLAAAKGKGGQVLPQLAPVARQSGKHAGRNIARLVAGSAAKRFRYLDKGTMATIGRGAAVADLPLGVHLTGFLGWLSWLGLHLLFLVGVRNRVSVFVSWAWNYLTWDRGPRLIVEPPTNGRSIP